MLLAVHISDGVLAPLWWSTAFPAALLLVALGARRLRDEEIPRIALLTAAFFIASSIHIRVGPTSVHLLLNGLVGVLLGPRAALAVAVGLVLQVMLLNHGGYQTLGVNTCLIAVPALLCGALFRGLHRIAWLRTTAGRGLLMGSATLLWVYGAAYSLALLRETSFGPEGLPDWSLVNARVLQPWLLAAAVLSAGGAAWCERRLENTPDFPLGFLIGLVSVFATVALDCVVLIAGGAEVWHVPALIWVVVHLPVAVVEGVVLGFTVGFLAQVKPELLGTIPAPDVRLPPACAEPCQSAP
jgi:ABC-type Co2+ transport system permease subunit